jgi:hypothetical protein
MNDANDDEEKSEATPTGTGKGKGWTALADADTDILRNQFPADFASVLTLWIILVREARFKKSLSFAMKNEILADRAKMGIRTVKRKKKLLMETGLASCASAFVPAAGTKEATIWTLSPSVSPIRKKDTEDTGKGCHSGTPPVPTKARLNGPNSYRASFPSRKGKLSSNRSRLTPPTADAGLDAGTAGGGGFPKDGAGERWRGIQEAQVGGDDE